MKRTFCCLMLAAMAAALMARPARAANEMTEYLESRVVDFTLPNGLRFLVLKRGDAPTFFGMVRFKVGSVDEVPGITGLAHMFEHMVFKGTDVIGTLDYRAEKPLLDEIEKAGDALSLAIARGESEETVAALRARLKELEAKHAPTARPEEFSEIYARHGGSRLNATTNSDFTTYFVSLPSTRLELWMMMESERFKNPVMREFYRERDVVMEERRMRTETQPFGALYEAVAGTAFMAHPYRMPTVGYMSDLRTMTMADAKEFFQKYYVPRRAVVALVGDIDPKQVKALAEKYFGGIPAAPDPPPVRTVEPPQQGERRVTLDWDAEPIVAVSYHVPTVGHPDHYALDALNYILSTGDSSRLQRALVQKGIAASIWGSRGPGYRYPHVLGFWCSPMAGRSTEEVEQALYAELDRVKSEPVAERELDRVRNAIEAQYWKSLSSNQSVASQLTMAAHLYGDWREAFRLREALDRITPEDLTRVANTYFTEANRSVVTLRRPVPPVPESPAPAPPKGRKG